jgi:uncharacterized coiled-coil protein SlyX
MAIPLNARIHQLELTLAEARQRRLMRSQREQFRALVDSLTAMPNSAESIREDRDHGHRSNAPSR